MVDIEKSRTAAAIAQSALVYIVRQLQYQIGQQSIGEVCRLGDKFIADHVQRCYKGVAEKGVALPVQICKNEYVSGVSPEESDQGGVVHDGDVVKIALGVHIDGYTSQVAHTIVIRQDLPVTEPFAGSVADACIGAYLATEAVVALLGSVLSDAHPLRATYPEVTSTLIQQLVNSIATDYGLEVVPGSRVRRVKRFVAGQPTVHDSLEAVEWPPVEDADEFTVQPGQQYLVDISMASRAGGEGSVRVSEAPPVGSVADPPAIYSRDHTVSYNLRTQAARQLLKKVSTVYPFKLSSLAAPGEDLRHLRLGVSECVQRHLLVALPAEHAVFVPASRPKDSHPVPVAREMTTVVLVPGAKSASGFPETLRLGGGRQLPPSWLHSPHELSSGVAADALNAHMAGHQGIKYLEVPGNLKPVVAGSVEEDASMDIEV